VSITVIIPHIPVAAREPMLQQAIDSVYTQTVSEFIHKPIVITDTDHRGAAWSVAQGVAQVKTKWLTLLGDDDWLMPRHHQTLMYWAEQTGADVVYGDPVLITDGYDKAMWNIDWDEARQRRESYIPGGGSLIRTELLQRVGVPQADSVQYAREMSKHDDWAMYMALLDGGAKFHHVDADLYCWRVWSGNTSGRGDRW
jgi:hypothetical protein